MDLLSKDTKRLLIEMSIGVLLYNMVLAAAAYFLMPRFGVPFVPVLLGLAVGAAAAVAMLIHMAAITERVLGTRDENYANKMTVVHAIGRKIVLVAVLFACWRILKINLLAAVIGAMGMKAGAYMQPLVHIAFVRLGGAKSEVS